MPTYCLTNVGVRELAKKAAYMQILWVEAGTDGIFMKKQNLVQKSK